MAGQTTRTHAHSPRGFTLIELLVAIAVMALIAILSWRGLDGMVRAQSQTRERADDVLVLQASLAQWKADLDAMAPSPTLTALDWDGRVLRLTRRTATAPDDGLRVVAWSRRADDGTGRWLRWQSPPLRSRAEWAQAWSRAQQWAQNPVPQERLHEVPLLALDDWQIFYYRSNAWTHPLSSAGLATGGAGLAAPAGPAAGPTGPTGALSATASLPSAVRLVLTLSPGQAIAGTITLDWVSPTVGGGKS